MLLLKVSHLQSVKPSRPSLTEHCLQQRDLMSGSSLVTLSEAHLLQRSGNTILGIVCGVIVQIIVFDFEGCKRGTADIWAACTGGTATEKPVCTRNQGWGSAEASWNHREPEKRTRKTLNDHSSLSVSFVRSRRRRGRPALQLSPILPAPALASVHTRFRQMLQVSMNEALSSVFNRGNGRCQAPASGP